MHLEQIQIEREREKEIEINEDHLVESDPIAHATIPKPVNVIIHKLNLFSSAHYIIDWNFKR